MRVKHIAAILLVVAVGIALFMWPTGDTGANTDAGSDSPPKQDGRKGRLSRARRNHRLSSKIDESRATREKPVIEETDEEKELDEEMRQILSSIRKALSDADLRAIRSSIAKMRASALANGATKLNWTSRIPKVMRRAAVEAVGYFGVQAIADLLDFVVDEDAEVAQDAISQLELAMQDFSLGDRDRAEIFKSLSSVLTDSDALDWMLAAATDARHSVGVDTFSYISKNGTSEAKSMLSEYIDLFTGGEATTVADAETWLGNNPDQPDDDEFYGPIETK